MKKGRNLKEYESPEVPFELKNGTQIMVGIADVRLLQQGIRPLKMEMEAFRELRNQIKKAVASQTKGTMFHMAKMTEDAWLNFLVDSNAVRYKAQKGRTYKKKKDEDV